MRSKYHPRFNLQHLLAKHLPEQKATVNSYQLRILNALSKCKTAALGGHKERCLGCGHTKVHYNSCGNRHCPGCQGVNRERWLIEREYDLFDVPYHHVTFTVPSALRDLFYKNQRVLYTILFSSMWDTLLSFSKDPRSRLSAQIGVISILHTWTQKLCYHPHLHCIVPDGGLTQQGKWKEGKGTFLFPVKAMSIVFKHKFCDALNQAYAAGKLHTDMSAYDLDRFISQLKKQQWVVHSKPGFKGKKSVMEYLGRYTHKIAISNYRLLTITDSHVTFSYRDRKAGDVKKVMSLPIGEFIKRFSWHILPRGFVKIRSYGLFSNRNKKSLLPLVFEALKQTIAVKPAKLTAAQVIRQTTGQNVNLCPKCRKGRMVVFAEIAPLNKGSPNVFMARRKEVLCSW